MVNLHGRRLSGQGRQKRREEGRTGFPPIPIHSPTPTAFPSRVVCKAGETPDLQNLEGRDDSPQSQTDAVALLRLQYFTLFFFFSSSSFACLWITVSGITPDASCSSCRCRCSGISKRSRGCSWGDVTHVAHPSSVREERCTNRTAVHPPNPRTFFACTVLLYTQKSFFQKKKLRWSFARTHEDGRSRQIGAENRPFHPTAREI